LVDRSLGSPNKSGKASEILLARTSWMGRSAIARWYSQKLPILVLFYDQAQPIYPP